MSINFLYLSSASVRPSIASSRQACNITDADSAMLSTTFSTLATGKHLLLRDWTAATPSGPKRSAATLQSPFATVMLKTRRFPNNVAQSSTLIPDVAAASAT